MRVVPCAAAWQGDLSFSAGEAEWGERLREIRWGGKRRLGWEAGVAVAVLVGNIFS